MTKKELRKNYDTSLEDNISKWYSNGELDLKLFSKIRGYSNGELVDIASDFKYSNLFNKISDLVLRVWEVKHVCRDILGRRGVDWKTRQVERYEARKRAKNMYWNKLKRELIAPFANLYSHVVKTYSEINNVENKMWKAAFAPHENK